MNTNNQQFTQMRTAAIDRLKPYSPEEIIKKANIPFNLEKSEFVFTSLGQTIHLSYPDFNITPELEMWYHLTILQYIDTADGSCLTHNLISISEMKDGGLVRGLSFDRNCSEIIKNQIGNQPEDMVRKACKKLGGKFLDSRADLSVEFSFMPNFPVTLNLWFADEEMDATGKFLFDENANHYLGVEAVGTVMDTILNQLIQKIKEV